ncbi:MAG TPA: hypothetical protein VMU47_08790 [Caldimonas sp.]|nr:hypothetical protein [Caldimonas sp.]
MTSRPTPLACACAAALAWSASATLAATPAKHAAAAKAAPAPAKEVPLPDASPEQQKAAELVFYGDYECEFNQTVNIQADPKHLYYVNVKHGKGAWLMKPVLSTTGAMRLEDVKGETLMVQIASKSMLLNTKTGQRLVDACVSPRQRELMEAAKAMKERAIAAGVPEAPALLSGGSPTPTK